MYYTKKFIFIAIIFISFLYAADTQAGVIIRPSMNVGLVGYWNFDVGKGGSTAYDMSGQRNHGTLTNMNPATDWVDSATTTGRLLGQALDFDGNNDYVSYQGIPLGSNPGSNYTMSVWFKSAVSHVGTIVQHGGDFTGDNTTRAVLFVDGTTLKFSTRGDGFGTPVVVSSSFSIGVWHHAVGVVSENIMSLYIDGIEVGTPATQATSGVHRRLSIGASGDNGGTQTNDYESFFNGLIDEVRIYNRALSTGEVSRLYKVSRPKIAAGLDNTGLVGYWSFNEGTGTVAGDASGNGNNGTLTNGPTWTAGKLGSGLSFDGSNDYVNVANESNFDFERTNPFSIGWWMKHNPSATGIEVVVNKMQNVSPFSGWDVVLNFNGSINDAGKMDTQLINNVSTNLIDKYTTNDTKFLDGNWHHYVMTYNGSSVASGVQLYEDGINLAMTTRINTLSSSILNNRSVTLASRDGTAYYTKTSLDEVRVYNRSLSAAEIQKLYNSGLAKINASTVGKLNNGLVGHWTFDGPDMADVTAFDRSGQGNSGTLTNGPSRAIGKLGQALNFDGSNDYVDTKTQVWNGVGDFTATAWFKISSTDGLRDLISQREDTNNSQNNGFWLIRNNANVIQTVIRDTGNTYTLTISLTGDYSDGLWHFVSLRRVGNVAYLNIDGGKEEVNGSAANDIAYANNVFRIGAYVQNIDYWSGLIDEVRIYNRALSDSEVKRLYNMGR